MLIHEQFQRPQRQYKLRLIQVNLPQQGCQILIIILSELEQSLIHI